MTQPTCALCGRPVPDQAVVCDPCAEVVRVDLLRIVELAPEVETTVAKLTAFGDRLGGGTGERPLPFDPKAAERAEALKGTLSTWARHVSEERGRPVPRGPGELGAQAAARFLAANVGWLRHREEAPEAFEDLRRATGELVRLVDRPAEMHYRGPCWADLGDVDEVGDPLLCQEILYVPKGARVLKCRECGAEHDAEKRRKWLLDEARSTLTYAEHLARALTQLEIENVTPARIRGMARHGRIAAHGANAVGDPLYNVGEVLDVIDEQDKAERERKAAREAKAAKRKETAA